MLKITNKKDTINLIICTYGGRNRWVEKLLTERSNVPVKDTGVVSYIKKQIKSLSKYRHSQISQITFVINTNSDIEEYKEFVEIMDNMPSHLRGVKVDVLRRMSNVGCSMGAFSWVSEIYKDKFDFYYFLEDDGIFVRNDFDIILLNKIKLQPGCDMLVTYRNGDLFCSSCLIRSESIGKLEWKIPIHPNDLLNRKIPIPKSNFNLSRYNSFQAAFLSPFNICTLGAPYGRCPYFGYSNHYKDKMIFKLHGVGDDYLLVPAQMVDLDTCTPVEPLFNVDGFF